MMVEPKEGKEVTIDQEDRSGLHNTPANVNVDIVEDSQPGPSTNINIEESIMPLRLEVNIKFRWGSKSSCSNTQYDSVYKEAVKWKFLLYRNDLRS